MVLSCLNLFLRKSYPIRGGQGLILLITLILLSGNGLSGQVIRTGPFLPYQPGDTLQYQLLNAPADAPFAEVHFALHDFRGSQTLKSEDKTGFFRLESHSPAGWTWYLIHQSDGTEVLPDKPLLVLPADSEKGQTYTVSQPCTFLKNGQKTGRGRITVAFTVDGIDSARMPFRNFEDCLTLTQQFKLERGSIVAQQYEEKMWFAEGIGLVKGVRQIPGHKGGKPTRIPYQLAGGNIGGKPLDGRRP